MSLSQALSIAMSGLRANQLALSADLVERRQFRHAGLHPQDRQPDPDVLWFDRRRRQRHRRQSRTSTCICSSRSAPSSSGASYADLRSSILSSLQSIYGSPRRHRNAGNRVQ